jgi:hypothetical protein
MNLKFMNETPKKKSGWRILRRLLVALAIFVTLIAIFYAEEDWRGKRAWENYQREAASRGERLDPASVIPPAVPDDQNFFFAPIVANTLNWNPDQKTNPAEPRTTNAANRINFDIYRGDSKIWPEHGGNWQKGRLTDLKEWQQYFRTFAESPGGKTNGYPVASQPQTPAADILLALSVFDPATEELRQASRRPYARLPLDYESGFDTAGELLPCLANVKRYGQFLSLRILAELDAGQSAQALDDIKLLLRVTDSLHDQPYLISHLVRIAMMAITLQPIYEGLAQQRWSDAQLLELEQALAKLDFLADFQHAMQGEKVFAIQAIEKERITHEYKTEEVSSGTNKIITVSLRWMPGAFFYQNELAFAQMHRQYILPLIDQTNRIIALAALRQAQAAEQVQKKHYSPYKAQAQMVFPAIAPSVKKFAMIQAQVDLARVACALERFRLAHSEYPESLDTLAPQFIEKMPHDIINGQPLHYRRTDDGKFVLYSVGWDEKDDGGKIFLTKNGAVDREKGDWVWQYPLK